MAKVGDRSGPEHRWPVVAYVVVIIVIWLVLPDELQFVPRWVVPAMALVILLPLIVFNPKRLDTQTTWSRWIGVLFAAGLVLVNQLHIALLIVELVNDDADGPNVLVVALAVWITNVIAFAILFWELDDGGPVARRVLGTDDAAPQDFLFPQQGLERIAPGWKPVFFDYVSFSLSTMMAFSPTDVMPLTTRAKALMSYEALTGFVLLALVISRAVNILTPG
ncbi:MAG: hypothetical protein M3Y46_08310 [Actinomycetota bacterium]|nr:hypothetical protein [Actinomycetota bacterium]